MNRIVLSTTLALAAATPFALHGGDFPDDPNRLSFGARFGFNFKAAFHNNATLNPGNPAVNPGPATGGADHTYNDGYVLVDSSGNAGGLTWNWGYQNAAQVAGDTMQFHAIESSSPSAAINHVTDDPQYGAELTYQRVIGPFLPSGRWGLEAGFGYTDLDLRDNRSGTGLTTVTTDTFPLNGVLPPSAGYNGTFQGPGALLGDTPDPELRTIASDTATLTSHQKLSGQLYTIRLGPFAEWNFTPQLSLAASVGLTLAPSSVDYDFSETSTLAGGGTSVASGHSFKNELLYGYYVSAMLRYEFNERCGAYVGAQFQSLNGLEQSIGGRTARLDQGATVYGTVGVSWRF